MISFNCPNCGKKVSTKDTAAGKRGKCPGCGVSVQVPALASDDDVLAALGEYEPPKPIEAVTADVVSEPPPRSHQREVRGVAKPPPLQEIPQGKATSLDDDSIVEKHMAAGSSHKPEPLRKGMSARNKWLIAGGAVLGYFVLVGINELTTSDSRHRPDREPFVAEAGARPPASSSNPETSPAVPKDAMVRVAVYDDTESVPIPERSELWFRGNGSWWLAQATKYGSDFKNVGRRPIGIVCRGDDSIVLYPDGRQPNADGREMGQEINVPIMMTTAMNPDGSHRDTIHIAITDHEVTIEGLAVKAASGEDMVTVKRAGRHTPSSESPRGNVQPPGIREHIAVESPKVSKKAEAFRAKVASYLEEARAGAKLLTLVPSLEEITSKAQQITELYTHLPDVPPEIDTTGELAEKLKNINGGFAVGAFMVRQRLRAERLGSLEAVKEVHQGCAKIATEVRKIADEIESGLNL